MSQRIDKYLDAQHGGIMIDEQFVVIRATFSPPEWTRHVSLKPEALPLIGTRCAWQSLWRLNEEDSASSPFVNDWAMRPLYSDNWPFAWCRLSDLIERELISAPQTKDGQ